LVATTDGEVYAWGYNGNGLGNGSGFQSPRSTPVRVSFPTGVRIVEVSGSCNGYLARSDQGAVYQWGAFYGMWDRSTTTPVIALAAGSVSGASDKKLLSRGCSSAFAVKADGSFFAWGSNGGGKLGNGSTSDSATPVSVTILGKSVTQLSASSTHTLAVTSDGFVYAWGGNSNGQLARNPSSTSFINTPTRVGTISNAVSVSASDSSPYSSLVSNSGSVFNWGSYFGMGSDSSAYVPTALASPPDLTTQIVSGTGYQNGQAFVGQDGSIWTRGLYANDGNCGADSNSYSTWVNGRMQAPRTLVRVFSSGQFGDVYVEDEISVNSMKTAAGAILNLDGSGVVSAVVGQNISLEASRPSSQCFSADQLDYAWDLDADGQFDDAAATSQDSFGNLLVTGSIEAATAQPRTRGGLRISNDDGYVKEFNFDVRITDPVQNVDNSNTSLPYVANWDTDNGDRPGVAVGTNGKLYSWGSSDISENGNSPLPSPVTTPADDPNFTKVVGGSFFTYTGNDEGSYGSIAVALSDSGQIYVWGSGGRAHPGTPGAITYGPDNTRVSVPTLVETPTDNDAAVDVLIAGGRVIVLTVSGRVWTWGRQPPCDLSPCEIYGPEEIQQLTGSEEILSDWDGGGLFTRIGGEWSQIDFREDMDFSTSFPSFDGADIVTTVNREFMIGRFGSDWKREDGTNFVVPDGVVIDVIALSTELWFVMGDGSIWTYESSDPPSWRRVHAPGTAVRFAGDQFRWQGSAPFVSPSGKVFNAGGTCSQQGQIFSDGNLGPAYAVDGVTAYLTDEVSTTDYNYARSYGETLDSWDSGTVMALHTEVSATKNLMISIGSDCLARSGISVSVDIDDDGTYETPLTLSAIDSDSYVDSTLRFAGSANRGQAEIVVEVDNAGGRYIGIRVESENVFDGQNSVTSVRLPVVFEPTRPSGRFSGVSINRGAEFTESADVTLGLVWPTGAVTAEISNDGGFETSRSVPLDASINWRLSDLTSGKVGSAVYVKFLGLDATADGSWQEVDIMPGPAYSDNITMDLTPPVVSTAEASVVNSQSAALRILGDFASKIRSLISVQSIEAHSVDVQNARVTIGASDAGSGITSMQITSDPAIPGPELPYQSSITMPVVKDTVALRVKDNVGNWSTWRFVRVSGFQPIVEVPNPGPNNPAPNPAPNPIPAAPTGPVQLQIAPKAKVTSGAVAASLGAVIPAKSKVTLTVSKASKKICKVSGGKLVALKPGNCSVSVTVQPPKPKKGKKPKAVKTSGIVKIN
jgi:alpha-tubulin suppressor-like RCC1 family protein